MGKQFVREAFNRWRRKLLEREHIWQVTVKPRGLGNGKNLTAGPYRLCLTNKTLSLVRLSQQVPDIVFQLASLRRCGHSDCFFFMEAGTSAVTGAGELWMQVEDTVIARNIHETILRNMAGDQAFRPRSRSSVTDRRSTKPISVPSNSRGTSPGYDSSTLPVRSKTISGDHPGSPTPPSRLRPGGNKTSSSGRSSTTSSLGRGGHSPVPTSPLGHTLSEAYRSRTDSMESRGSRGTVSSVSADELDLSPHEHHSSTASTRSVTPEGGASRDEASYLSMAPMGSKDMLVSPTTEAATPGRDGYMEMSVSGGSSYMDMSPGDGAYHEIGRASFSSSPAMSTTSSGLDTDEHCYLDMASIAHSLPTVQERITDAGYLDMSPGNTWAQGPIPRPERMHSYLSDDQASTEDFPRRAYSVGSKPTSVKSCAESNVASYVDMTGKNGALDKVNPKSSSAPHLVDKEKGVGYAQQREDVSWSTKELSGGRTTAYNKELLMEVDFLSQGSSSFRPRTSSAGRDFRNRASSIEQATTRRRTGSFGKESGVSRTASMGRHDRPRTTTICQDTFRNRTSSFGSSDTRPRSSSHGNRTYYKGKVSTTSAPTPVTGTGSEKGSSETDSRGSSRHSSQESLRRTLHKASEDYGSSKGSQDSYMDMLMHRTPSPSVLTNLTPTRINEKAAAVAAVTTQKINSLWQDDEYLAIAPGDIGAASCGPRPQPTAYMDMTYTPETHKDIRWRTSSDGVPIKTSEVKSATPASKSRGTRSSIKSQHHRLYLRMPSADSKSGDGSAQQTESAMEDSERPANKSPGEYIDIGFSKPSGSPTSLSSSLSIGLLMKQISSEDETNKAVWSPQTDEYAIYSPGPSLMMSPVRACLDPVICPLRLDDDDDTPSASPTSLIPDVRPSMTNPLKGTPMLSDGASDEYMLLGAPEACEGSSTQESTAVITSDPFTLLQSPNKEAYMRTPDSVSASSTRGSRYQEQKALSSVKTNLSRSSSSSSKAGPVLPLKGSSLGSSTSSCSNPSTGSRSRLGSNGSKNLSSRKSPVLPPKVRSKEKSCSSSSASTIVAPKVTTDARAATKLVLTSSAVATTVSITTAKADSDSTPVSWSPTAAGEHERRHVRHEVTSTSSLKNSLDHPKQSAKTPLGVAAPFAELVPLTLGVHCEKPTAPERKISIPEPHVAKAVAGKQRKLSGSTSSLTSLEPGMSSASVKPQIASCGSTSSLSSMDTSRTLTTSCAGVGSRLGPFSMHKAAQSEHLMPTSSADCDSLAVGGSASHHSSRTSVSSDKELNYASLDLASSQDESTFPVMTERSPRSPLICKAAVQSPVCEEEEEEPEVASLSYAEIDFAKSEELRTATSLRERLPFDVK